MADRNVVYYLRSLTSPDRYYVGITSDVQKRLVWHNAGRNVFTKQNRPWELVVAMTFCDRRIASRFEKYLKSGSGRAFAKRHFSTNG